jgi:Kef-type K+ transport system membrane component KefB
MSFGTLALICVIGIFGPLLAVPQSWHMPVVFGELVAGIAFGSTGFKVLHASNPTFAFLANIGFALIMFVAGTHVPVRDPALLAALKVGVLRAVGVGVLSAPIGLGLSHAFGTGHAALYAVLMASSSAALILPIVDSLHLEGEPIRQLLPQVAVADVVCIVALPLAIEPSRAGRAALGAVAVIACAAAFFLVLLLAERRGLQKRLHRLSEHRKFALELRINLAIVFALAALAVKTHVSVLLAGFSFGLATARIGEPRRLARQLFAVTEGFLGPLFFVWLGASLNLRQLGERPSFIVLGLALGAGAIATHAAMSVTGQPIATGVLAAAQLGVPVAAATLGTQLHLLKSGEAPALVLGALVSIAAATAASAISARAHASSQEPPAAPSGRLAG